VFGYVVRRLLISIPILLLVVTMVFFAFQLIPGDPARMYAGEQASADVVERLRHDLGLDRPVLEQYVGYLGRLSRGDLGDSIFTRRPVMTEIQGRFWNTVKLSLSAIAFASVAGIALGAIAATNRGRLLDHIASVVVLFGISIPVFWLGLLMMYVFSLTLGILPTAGDDGWRNYIMPTIALAVFSLAFIARMTRSSLLEAIGQDYIRTARAKGLKERNALIQHALRNALLPILTVVGYRRAGFCLARDGAVTGHRGQPARHPCRPGGAAGLRRLLRPRQSRRRRCLRLRRSAHQASIRWARLRPRRFQR
jgi:ABC-type dipeptide/oligopeptide/nickel transport system permease component